MLRPGAINLGLRSRIEFSPHKIVRRMRRGSAKPLSLAARDVYQEARKSISKKGTGFGTAKTERTRKRQRKEQFRKKGSIAPHPPYSWHARYGLRDSIRYAVDESRLDAVIGPRKRGSFSPKIWRLMEFGGTQTMYVHRFYHLDQEYRIISNKPRLTKRGKKSTESFVARYAARPYMGPAFRKRKPQLAKFWQDSVR